MKQGVYAVKSLPGINEWYGSLFEDSPLVKKWPSILAEAKNKANLDKLSKDIVADLWEYGSSDIFSRGGGNLNNLGPIGVTDIDGNSGTLLGGSLIVSPHTLPKFDYFSVSVGVPKGLTVSNIAKSKDLASSIQDIIAAVNGFKSFVSTLDKNYKDAVSEYDQLAGKWTDMSKNAVVGRKLRNGFMKAINREAIGKIDQYLNTVTSLIAVLNAVKQ